MMLQKKLPSRRNAHVTVMNALMSISILAVTALVLFLVGYVMAKGAPHIT